MFPCIFISLGAHHLTWSWLLQLEFSCSVGNYCECCFEEILPISSIGLSVCDCGEFYVLWRISNADLAVGLVVLTKYSSVFNFNNCFQFVAMWPPSWVYYVVNWSSDRAIVSCSALLLEHSVLCYEICGELSGLCQKLSLYFSTPAWLHCLLQ